MSNARPSHKVFIVESRDGDDLGSAWLHKDSKGLNIQLKPNIAVSGRIVLREWDDEPRSKGKSAA